MKFALMIYQPHPFDASSYMSEGYQEIAAGYAAINATPGVSHLGCPWAPSPRP